MEIPCFLHYPQRPDSNVPSLGSKLFHENSSVTAVKPLSASRCAGSSASRNEDDLRTTSVNSLDEDGKTMINEKMSLIGVSKDKRLSTKQESVSNQLPKWCGMHA